MEINVDYIREHLNIKLKKIEVLSEFFIKLIKIKKELLTFDEIKNYNVFTCYDLSTSHVFSTLFYLRNTTPLASDVLYLHYMVSSYMR